MVDGTGLENRHTGNRIGGSNPSLSAMCSPGSFATALGISAACSRSAKGSPLTPAKRLNSKTDVRENRTGGSNPPPFATRSGLQRRDCSPDNGVTVRGFLRRAHAQSGHKAIAMRSEAGDPAVAS